MMTIAISEIITILSQLAPRALWSAIVLFLWIYSDLCEQLL